VQETGDAYLRAGLMPLGAKAGGLVAAVPVSGYQAVKSGDLLVELCDDDYQAHVREALGKPAIAPPKFPGRKCALKPAPWPPRMASS
jgi:multidrug resistance efflux pump